MRTGPTSCGSCAWWCRGGAQIAKAERDPGLADDRGTCQLRPPETAKIVGGWVEAIFPVTHESRFCGSWAPVGDPGPDGGEESPAPIETGEVVPLRRKVA